MALINEQLWLGHFDLWKEDGMLLYRHGLLLAGAETHVGAMRGAAQGCARGLRALLSVLPVRAVGGQVGRGRARRHHARDARTGMSLSLAGPLLLVGAGKMGGALLEGWLRQGLDPAHVFMQDPAPAGGCRGADRAPRIASARAELPAKPSVIVLAVKPQLVDEALPGARADDRQGNRGVVDRRRPDACQSRAHSCRRARRSCGRCRTPPPLSATA